MAMALKKSLDNNHQTFAFGGRNFDGCCWTFSKKKKEKKREKRERKERKKEGRGEGGLLGICLVNSELKNRRKLTQDMPISTLPSASFVVPRRASGASSRLV